MSEILAVLEQTSQAAARVRVAALVERIAWLLRAQVRVEFVFGHRRCGTFPRQRGLRSVDSRPADSTDVGSGVTAARARS